jgi:paraquat-inducible protein A
MSQSLRDRYPWRIEVPLLMLASLGLLLMAYSLPLMSVEKLVYWKNEYSIIAGVRGLWDEGQFSLSIILFFFSIVFPLFKLAVLGVLWVVRLSAHKREFVLHWLGILGKWSMLDVFVVAILIVLVKLGPLVKVRPQRGVYWFAAGVVLSMITSMYVDRLARKAS